MKEALRFTLNRSAMQLICKQPYLDWASSLDQTQSEIWTLQQLNDDNDIFMIPQFVDPRDSMKWVVERWHVFFDNMLFDWETDEAMWPQNRTLKMFLEWFDIRIHSLVWDMANEPLTVEDWSGEDGVDEDEPDGILH
jgi:hypothetical protein